MVVLPPVLYAEDESSDAFFMQEAFSAASVANPLVTVPDGKRVLHYLQAPADAAEKMRAPCLLLLDLKLPLMDGFEVLAWLRQQSRWRRRLPVIVISSSGQTQDIKRALDLGAQEYLIKPSDFNSLIPMVLELKRRWLEPAPAPQPPVRHPRARKEA